MAAVLLGLVLVTGYTANPAFCGRCHEMAPYYKSWVKSPHKKFGCLACHQDPGPAGFVLARLSELKHFSLRSTYYRRHRPIRASRLNSASCRACHEKMIADTLVKGAIRVRHKDFVNDISCAECHRRVGHKHLTLKQPSDVKHKCMACHGLTGRAPAECPICHLKQADRPVKLDDYPIIRIAPSLLCKKCHE